LRDPLNHLVLVLTVTLLYISYGCCSHGVKTSSLSNNSTHKNRVESEYVDPIFTLECHRREYTFKAVRYDELGRKCWQYVTVMSCWGRCDSGEVRPDYHFLSLTSSASACNYLPDVTRIPDSVIRTQFKHDADVSVRDARV
jgi:hypothetical protein